MIGLPDKAAHPEVLQALVMRRRIRQAAKAAHPPSLLARDQAAAQLPCFAASIQHQIPD